MCGRVMMMIRLLSAILLLLLIRLYRDPEVTGKRRKREKKREGGVCVPSARLRWNLALPPVAMQLLAMSSLRYLLFVFSSSCD